MKLNFIKLILGYFLIIFFLPNYSNSNAIVFEEIVCEIKINKKNKTMFFLNVADTSMKRNYGLMNRKFINPNSGMLFIWKNSQKRTFWMKNTNFDLDLFFLDNPVFAVGSLASLVNLYFTGICNVLFCFVLHFCFCKHAFADKWFFLFFVVL